MKSMKYSKSVIALAVSVAPSLAMATNGYFLPGSGFRSQGMGGVGIAYGRDSLSTAANPANAINTGMRADLGVGIFNPERHARVYEDGVPPVGGFGFSADTESDSRYFIVPEMGFTMQLSERLSIGVAVVGNGGMNTTYPENFFSFQNVIPPKDQKIGVDMMQLLVPISVAYKVNENHAVGASLVLAETRFRAYGLDAFVCFDAQYAGDPAPGCPASFAITSDPEHMTDNGFDYSYGAGVRVGWLGEFLDDKLTVGLTYASKTYMTKFDKYRGLFAEQGDFDIPENYGIGIAVKPVKNLVIAADVFRINYADIKSVANRGPGDTVPVPGNDQTKAITSILADTNNDGVSSKETGNDDGMGFGWKSQTVYKLGVQYGLNNRLLLRAGYNYGKSPIPDDQVTFNLLAPATVEHHYSVGFTYKANDNLEVTGTYMYVAPNGQQKCGQNIVDCAAFDMHQNVFALSFGWVLDPSEKSMEEYGETEWAGINFDGWYAGFNFGQSRYRDLGVSTANTRTEGWKVYSGYQFNKYLGVEGGYANLNDFTATTATARIETESNAWALSAVGSYPLTDKFSVMARLGAAYVLTSTSTKVGTALAQRSGDDGYQPYYGLGVKYALLDNIDLRAEWERFDLDDSNIDLMTAGVAMKF